MKALDPRYNAVAMALHWLMAALVLSLMVLGWLAVNQPLSPLKFDLFYWHKSLGILTLTLAVLRLLWRWLRPPPPPDQGLAVWQRRAAAAVHGLLYLLLLLMPLSGWLINSAAKFPFRVFGLFPLPHLVGPDKTLQANLELLHLIGFWCLAGLLLLHVGAALDHHFRRRDRVLRRMLPAWGSWR
jgi:cytochrome b561